LYRNVSRLYAVIEVLIKRELFAVVLLPGVGSINAI
jgi:hypothetical protein